eukprot:GHVO01064754.1.p1 GENE.GHVO01064754.1~~GHVO01064754.1.p1  ORF type:complete len:389 (+),score=-11.85 GHVO01064754.1:266-1432(+)
MFFFEAKLGVTCGKFRRTFLGYYLVKHFVKYTAQDDCSIVIRIIYRLPIAFGDLERGVQWTDLRMLLDLYSRQQARVAWGNSKSPYFSVSNGIRQGSIISPILCSVYLDPLIDMLGRSETGCWVGDAFYGAMIYADDITLLCPSIGGIRNMLQICEKFCAERGIKFNATKSVCMRFSLNRNVGKPTLKLGGEDMKWEESVRHLGNYVSKDLSERVEVCHKRGDMFGRVNALLGNCLGMPRDVVSKLITSQCFHLYGCQAWRLADPSIDKMSTAINRCTRRALGLHPRTHRFLLPPLLGCSPFNDQIKGRCRTMLNSIESQLGTLYLICFHDSASIISTNSHSIASQGPGELTLEQEAIVSALVDLEGGIVDIFGQEEARAMFEYLCIN